MMKFLRHAAHYIAAIALLADAGLSFAGVQLPGVSTNPHVALLAGFAGLGLAGVGAKVDQILKELGR